MPRDLYTHDPFSDPRAREGFGKFVKGFVAAAERARKQKEINAKRFLKDYGIKHCPVHGKGGVSDVVPDAVKVKFGDNSYDFMYLECGLWNNCQSLVSLDEGLIERLDSEELVEVQKEDFTRCVTCGSDKGSIFYTGFLVPVSIRETEVEAVSLEQGVMHFSAEKMYLAKRPCHSYVFANSGGLDLRLK